MIGNRRKTRSVRIGRVTVGGDAPIAVQSMTTTTPLELEESLVQIGRLIASGCDIVRVTVPSVAAAEALARLRFEMNVREWFAPLVADVHFSARAAYEAALHVEKVRINPGNFASDGDEARRHLAPLLERLRARGAALRIGVNHGSLSSEIAAHHGHGPEGMAESALQYLRLCRDLGFLDTVVSLKASNPVLMAAANRLLAARMDADGFDSPFHLGVTEAGSGRDAEQRSAAGIGALLLDGIGDTIRVSLTGDPAAEIAVCRHVLAAVDRVRGSRVSRGYRHSVAPAKSERAACPPRVELALRIDRAEPDDLARAARAALLHPTARAESLLLIASSFDSAAIDGIGRGIASLRADDEHLRPDIWISGGDCADPSAAGTVIRQLDPTISTIIAGVQYTIAAPPASIAPPELDRADLAIRFHFDGDVWRRSMTPESDSLDSLAKTAARLAASAAAAGFSRMSVSYAGRDLHQAGRRIAAELARSADNTEFWLHLPADSWDRAVDAGALLLDGIAAGVSIEPADGSEPLVHRAIGALEEAYGLLQATRRRISRAEFISCPGCGRLQFDLEGATLRLRARFGHLRDVKIAVMGCAVNGPGEMADADFGYVGSVGGRVDLYVGGRRVARGLTPEAAEDALLDRIRERGLWIDPVPNTDR